MMETTAARAAADILVSPLRRDVEFLPSLPDDDGTPTGLLHDKFHDTFDKFGWREREILKRLIRPVRLDELHRDLREHTCVGVGLDELSAFLDALHRGGLLQSSARKSPGEYMELSERARRSGVSWLFGHYLFFRIPLLRPRAFLERTLWMATLFSSAVFRVVVLAALAALPFLLAPRLGMFAQSLTPFIALRGAIWLGVAVAAIKVVHEFSHAYAAAARGVKVRSMGVAFMMLFPIPYCDVTDAWRLNRRDRLAVDFAGVRSELIVALFSLCFWCLSPPGRFRDTCLVLGTASLLSTLLTNLNPGMRFDGYYLMSDIAGVDNLGARSFGLLRHYAHRVAFGVKGKNPEPAMAGRKRLLLSLYAVYACLYRLGLYFGIALIVYKSLPKVFGVLLFAVEIYAFILRPAYRECAAAAAKIREGRSGLRPLLPVPLFAALLLWFVLPLPHRIELDACVASDDQIVLHTPDYGRVAVNNLRRGAVVRAGEILFSLENDDLNADIAQNELELAESAMLLDGAAGNAAARERLRDNMAREERLKSLLASRRVRRELLAFRAEADSLVLDAAPGLKPGVHLGAGVLVGRVIPVASPPRVTAYVPEDALNRVDVGDAAVFVPGDSPGKKIPGRITSISPINSESIEEPALAGPHGGGMAVVPRPGAPLAPAVPVYRAVIELDSPDAPGLRLGQTGKARLKGRPVSLAAQTGNWLVRLLLRESGV